MNRFIVSFVACVVTMTIVLSPFVHADDQQNVAGSLSGSQIERIRANCLTVQISLNRIHANDGLLRVNLAQNYNAIASKLMAPMDSRISLNKLDGLAMSATTVEFNKQIKLFTGSYQKYENTLSKTLSMKCADKPVEFYEMLSLARSQRSQVNEEVKKLNLLVNQYIDNFRSFRKNLVQNGENN